MPVALACSEFYPSEADSGLTVATYDFAFSTANSEVEFISVALGLEQKIPRVWSSKILLQAYKVLKVFAIHIFQKFGEFFVFIKLVDILDTQPRRR